MTSKSFLKNVKFIFPNSHYDVPLNGMAMYENKKYWFEITNTTVKSKKCIYGLYAISDEEIKAEEQLHQLFRKYVGTHLDRDEYGKRCGTVKDQKLWNKFYDVARKYVRPNYDQREPIGKFNRYTWLATATVLPNP